MIMITVMGTLKNIPVIPQITPQKERAIIVTKGLTFKELPMSFGSIMLPINT